jgi:hypothetical protein
VRAYFAFFPATGRYTVVDFSMSPSGVRPSTAQRHAKPFFNLVVCHDFFDTLERLKIVLSPLAARYPGLQVSSQRCFLSHLREALSEGGGEGKSFFLFCKFSSS